VCKIAYPVEASFGSKTLYAYGYLIPAADVEEVRAWVVTPSGTRIEGRPVATFFPFDWFFQFDGLPALEPCRLVVRARDALGRTARDVTQVVSIPTAGIKKFETNLIMAYPPVSATPTPVFNNGGFSTWGFVSPANLFPNSMSAQITYTDAGTTKTLSGQVGAPQQPYNWRFEFNIPAGVTGLATLTVTADGANRSQQLSISNGGGGGFV
jgi:hypothetical protein